MIKKILKLIMYLGLFFLVLFLFRIGYGFGKYGFSRRANVNYNLQCNNSIYEIANYASYKMKKGNYKFSIKNQISFDQKYEKIGILTSYSEKFKKSIIDIHAIIKKYNSLIQYENRSGLVGNRCIHLAVGVPPEFFDQIIKEFKKIGKTLSLNINKTDKTNEYKKLLAKKNSLIKIKNSLISLKNRQGRISEYIKLENRILEIEEKIQSFGVKLGDYDGNKEFCTVKLTLGEGKTIVNKISLLHRVKVAFEWAIKYVALSVFVILIFLLSVYMLIFILKKLKIDSEIINNFFVEK